MNHVAGPPPSRTAFSKNFGQNFPRDWALIRGRHLSAQFNASRKLRGGTAAGHQMHHRSARTLVGVNYLTTLAPGPIRSRPGRKSRCRPFTTSKPPTIQPRLLRRIITGRFQRQYPNLLVGDLDPEDQHISFTIRHLPSPAPKGVPDHRLAARVPGVKKGTGYLTLPSVCGVNQATVLKARSHPYPLPWA